MVPPGSDARASVDQCALLLSYFYDDYLSDALRRTAKDFGVEYIDLNAKIATLGSEVEFYTDYCHLTPEGNRRVAEILGRTILARNPVKSRGR
jgi:lysophospholipase L1-like esterase